MFKAPILGHSSAIHIESMANARTERARSIGVRVDLDCAKEPALTEMVKSTYFKHDQVAQVVAVADFGRGESTTFRAQPQSRRAPGQIAALLKRAGGQGQRPCPGIDFDGCLVQRRLIAEAANKQFSN